MTGEELGDRKKDDGYSRKETAMAILKEKLSEEELKQVTGGLIVEAPSQNGTVYVLVAEMYDGKVTGIVNSDLNYIDFAAEMCDVSREVISVEEYERRFNRKFEFYKKPE